MKSSNRRGSKPPKRSAPTQKPRSTPIPEAIRTPQQLRAEIGRPARQAGEAQARSKPVPKTSSGPIWVWPSLIAILLLGFLLRIYGINFGLPHPYHGDETRLVNDAMRGFGGDFHATLSPYPALYTRFLFAVCGLPLLYGRMTGHYHSIGEFIISYCVNPTFVLLFARLATACLGTLAVLLTFLVGRKYFGERVGLIGALMLAASAQQGAYSHFAVPDVAQSVLILAAYFPLHNILTRGLRRDCVLAGLLIGLGAATGYFAVLLVPTLLLAAWLRHGKGKGEATATDIGAAPLPSGDARSVPSSGDTISVQAANAASNKPLAYMSLGLIAALGGFCLATPNTVRNPSASFAFFKPGLAAAYPGNGYNGAAYTLWQALKADWGLPVLLASLAGVALVLHRRRSAEMLFVIFPILYAAALGVLSASASRVLVAADPFLALFAANALWFVYDRIRGAVATRNKPALAWKIAWTAGVVFAALPPLWTLLQWDSLLGNTPDTRTQALKWAELNIPPGRGVCLQSPRSPLFGQDSQSSRAQAQNHSPDWGANAPLLTEAGITRIKAELSPTASTALSDQAAAALRQRLVYREASWTWPPPDSAALQQAGVDYVFTSDACGPLPAEWLKQMDIAAQGGILHFTPGSVAASLTPGMPCLPPRITVYALREAARP